MPESINTVRQRLVENISEASEIEHLLCLQYLYAALSIKTHIREGGCNLVQLELMRDWKRAILKVAREEMLHMALTCNLLTAIGATPYFQRPNFPRRSNYYPLDIEMSLSAFNLETLERFIQFEEPASMAKEKQKFSITDLYEKIRADFMILDPQDLLVGQINDQIIEREITDPTEEFDDDVRTGYGVEPFSITSIDDVNRAIDLIIEQGEGASKDSETSHWHTFRHIKSQYLEQLVTSEETAHTFSPGRKIIDNPVVEGSIFTNTKSLLRHPAAVNTAKLFNESYRLMLIMMFRFYQKLDENKDDRFALQQIIFFPLMTMVIRPLAEIITQLPATNDNNMLFAGPPFDFPRSIALTTDSKQAFIILMQSIESLGELAEGLETLYGHEAAFPEFVGRAKFIAENVKRLALNFKEFVYER